MKRQIAPSILSADFARLFDEIAAVEKAGADVIHVDVMDGHFVPNITVGPAVVASIRKVTKLPIDCHLMIEAPEKYVDAFAKAGADWISVHVETSDLAKLLPKIKKLGVRAGAVINPPTPVEKILPFVAVADFILVMTVNPGFGGQKMIPECLDKVLRIKEFCAVNKLNVPIQIDGGVNLETLPQILRAAPDILVAGNAVFHAKDYKKAIDELRG